MWTWIKSLDSLLRGQATQPDVLRAGDSHIPIFGLAVVIDLLGMSYGLCMGLFSLTPGGSGHPMQLLASTLKVPALFLLTLLVTFPSLYVFNALVGSQLVFRAFVRLLVGSLGVMVAILSSTGPIVGFFSFTTTSYSFMIVMNVAAFAVAGCLGMAFLLQTLHRMTLAALPPLAPSAASDPDAPPDPDALPRDPLDAPIPGPLDASADHVLGRHVNTVFRIWVLVFAVVGSQMAWVLRPFIGKPGQPFAWFRHPYSNFFEAVIRALRDLVS